MKANTENRRGEDEIDFRMLIYDIRNKWYYFLFSFILFSAIALLYIRYKHPVYEATSSILIKDTKNTSNNIEDIMSGDLFGNSKNVATEIGILKSRSILEETIHELNLDISYFSKEGLFDSPVYNTAPFIVKLLRTTDGVFDEEFNITITDATNYKLEFEADNNFLDDYSFSGSFHFGQEIKTPYFTLSILRNDVTFNISENHEYSFVINSLNKMFTSFEETMKVEAVNKDATIVQITYKDEIPRRALDFLNTLGKVYLGRDVKDKTSVAGLTLKFIDEQLSDISKSLNTSELELQKFKEQKGTVDLSEESKAYLERVTALDGERVKAELDLRSLDYLYEYVSGNKDVEVLAPTSIGIPDPLLIELIAKLKELQSKRKSLMYGSSGKSPAVKIIDEQIDQTKNVLIENINSIRNLTRESIKGLNEKLEVYESSIRKIPNLERELLGIQRNFSVNENIYLYLLQKKAETGIAKATAVSDNKVLDEALVDDIPVVPDKRTVYILSLLLAFAAPFIFILLRGYVRNTISSREEIENLTKIPIIGVVGHQDNHEKLVVANQPKSSVAEAFRSIRANLMFFGLTDQHKVILITSSVGGEGKSFSTLNLATVLTLQKHKVIIVGMDLRKPQLINELGVENNDGVSTLLIGKTTIDKVIQKTNVEGLDIIPSGPVPPNPSELLLKKEAAELIEALRNKYDYIIIDTPPVGIVSDAMMLMNLADVNIFILRENYSRKEYIKTINNYYGQGKVKNLCILYNDTEINQRYGRNYGYYDDEKKKRRFF